MSRVRFIAAALAVLALAAPATAQFPNIGGLVNKAQSLKKIGDGFKKIGEPEEIKLGGDLAAMIMGAAPLVQDRGKQAYVNRLGRWIAMHSERPHLPWKFGIIDSPAYNAFSVPGGTVLVTRGLVERMRNESELAAVLAHEIAHVEERHHLGELHLTAGLLAKETGNLLDKLPIDSLRSKLSKGLPGKAARQLDPGGDGAANRAYTALLEAGRDLLTRGLAREEEFEADRKAAVLAARSGYSPFGVAGVLQTLTGAEAEGNFSLHRKTHPSALDRIERIDAVIGTRFDEMEGLADDVAGFSVMRPQKKHRRKSR